jgi:hypothetical protein
MSTHANPPGEAEPGLTQSDFSLTADELAALTRYVADQARRHAEAGEDPPSGLRVVFDFCSVGRLVTAYFDGAVEGFEVSSDW